MCGERNKPSVSIAIALLTESRSKYRTDVEESTFLDLYKPTRTFSVYTQYRTVGF